MSRATESTPPDLSPNNRRPPSSGAVPQSVCPFCATVTDAPGGACRQCGMENSQATRAATRSKIGPWFVWQARNPSAPGMSWATLISLIERGRITSRSVVRGPTTGQLWRFASRVKGVSREFGSCWNCGSELQRDARLCVSCKRLQQPPANPDALFEVDLLSAPATPRSADMESAGQSPAAVTATVAVADDVRPVQMGPAPVPPKPKIAALPLVDMDGDALPIGMEMRAFSLAEDYAIGAAPRGRLGRKLLLAAVVAVLCGVAAGGYSPAFRDGVIRGYRTIVAKVTGRPNAPSSQPPAVAPVGGSDDSVMASHRQSVSPTSHTPLMNVHTDNPPPEIQIGSGKNTVVPKKPRKTPATLLAKSIVTTPLAPATQPGTAQVQILSPSTDPQAAERWAWERHDRAIEHEQKGEYSQALRDYEWIRDLRLPEGVGPLDVQVRLNHLKQLIQANPPSPPVERTQ